MSDPWEVPRMRVLPGVPIAELTWNEKIPLAAAGVGPATRER